MNHHFISDLHLGHKRILELDKRPFVGIEEHDDTLALRCAAAGLRASKEKGNACLWLLGDVAFRKPQLVSFLKVMRPYWKEIYLIKGNHDDGVAWAMRDQFTSAHEAYYLRVTPEIKVYLSHYAHRVWRNSNHGSYHLYGHSHGALKGVGRSMDVGAPCIGYSPISLKHVIESLSGKDSINHHEGDK